jgi:hypothetical protein
MVSTRRTPLFQKEEYDFGFGANIMASVMPWVNDTNEPATDSENDRRVIVNIPPRASMWFEWDFYDCRFHGPEGWTLTYGSWILTSPEGEVWTFIGFEKEEYPKGRFFSYTSPGGISYQVYDPESPSGDPYTDHGHIKGIKFTYQQDGKTVHRYLIFSYEIGYDNTEHVTSVTVSRQSGSVEPIERALFTYRTLELTESASSSSGSSSSSSSSGQATPTVLYSPKTITRQIYQNGAWVTLETRYYRHYGQSDPNGSPNAVKYEFDPEAYQRLLADPQVSDPETAPDSKVAQYATVYYEYGADGRISKRTMASGQESQYTYEEGCDPGDSRNDFRLKTTETRGDGSVLITFVNPYG